MKRICVTFENPLPTSHNTLSPLKKINWYKEIIPVYL